MGLKDSEKLSITVTLIGIAAVLVIWIVMYALLK